MLPEIQPSMARCNLDCRSEIDVSALLSYCGAAHAARSTEITEQVKTSLLLKYLVAGMFISK